MAEGAPDTAGEAQDEPEARPGVDVVIAVHNTERPIARAVRSVLEHNAEGARVTVVCHNISAEEIRPLLDARHRDQVRFLEHRDEFRSASGPFNAGMDAATAPYVCIMGSDDTLMPGALSSWFWRAERSGADAVMARLELGSDRRLVRT
ncbi:glycosyltransferase family 2 protein, partial [Occultella aeris]|uniref:glycosyltransferase family 2 protein n=1 Tax=Occultella aeris TaxID=2761496 RepID=UPI0018D2BAC8